MTVKKSSTSSISLVLIPTMLMLTACADSNVQRDVYQTKEECLADWGNEELCQDMPAEQVTQHSNGGGHYYRYWGPTYYPDERSVNYNGKTYSARSPANSRAFISMSSGSSSATSSHGTPVSRGGFGGHSGSSFGG